MDKEISLKLPTREYLYLKLWYEELTSKEYLQDYYKSLHQKIEAGDYQELTTKEYAILEQLFKHKKISSHNLFQYYQKFPDVIERPTIIEWFKKKTNKPFEDDEIYLSILAMSATEEEKNLRADRVQCFNLSNQLYKFLSAQEFLEADEFIAKSPYFIEPLAFEQIKGKHIQDYIATNFSINNDSFELDLQQTEAIASMAKHTLINSRAGTGKTRTLIGKILFINSKEAIPFNSICLFSFEKEDELNILNQFINNVRPSSNRNALNDLDKILTSEKLLREITGIKSRILNHAEKAEFIDLLMDEYFSTNKEFGKNVYEFYAQDIVKVDKKLFKNLKNYYNSVHDSRFLTLKGDYAKSLGEKWIADFLYENGVEYQYEKAYYPSKISTDDRLLSELLSRGTKVIQPDFYLPQYKALIEHSRINENEPDERNKVEFEKINGENWAHFKNRMQWKRDFWGVWRKDFPNKNNVPELDEIKDVEIFMETSLEEMLEGKEKFQSILKEILVKNGIKFNKLSEKELVHDIWQRNKNDFLNLMVSFCDHIENLAIESPKEFLKKIPDFKDLPNVPIFIETGLSIYEKYIRALNLKAKPAFLSKFKEYNTDEYLLILEAVKVIESKKANTALKDIRWILIDDFQDFSQSYYLLLKAMLENNPSIRLFLIGDNWQALYRNRGAENIFIEKTINYFPDIAIKEMGTNYRGKGSITQYSNKLMKRNGVMGMPSQSFGQDYAKSVFIEDINRPRPTISYLVAQQAKEAQEQAEEKLEPVQETTTEELTIQDEKTSEEESTNSNSDPELTAQEPQKETPDLKSALKNLMQLNNSNNNLEELGANALEKYFNRCVKIIKDYPTNYRILLIHKNNSIEGISTEEFCTRVKTALPEYQNIHFSTMFDAKPLETDLEIILQMTNEVIPSVNSRSNLFEFMGSGENVLVNNTDQLRLFYISMTRATSKVYILTEGGKESRFLEFLQ